MRLPARRRPRREAVAVALNAACRRWRASAPTCGRAGAVHRERRHRKSSTPSWPTPPRRPADAVAGSRRRRRLPPTVNAGRRRHGVRAARRRRRDFVELQGIARGGVRADIWTMAYDADGAPCDAGAADAAAHGALFAAWRRAAGAQFPRRRFRLCRGAHRDRHPDADPGDGEGKARRARLSFPRLPLPRPDAAHLRAPDHEALQRARISPSSKRTR